MSTRVRAAVVAVAAVFGALVTMLVLNLNGPTTPDEAAEAFLATQPSDEPSDGQEGQTEAPRQPVRTTSADLADGRPSKGAAPTSLGIEALDLQLPIRPLGVDKAGDMALPDTVNALAWYKFGSAPADRGATVIAGHVDTKTEGIGPLARLDQLAPGDMIEVKVRGQSMKYRIDAVRQVSKNLLDLKALFSRVGPPRLHLITCAGAYDPDRGGYQANLVVVARPVD